MKYSTWEYLCTTEVAPYKWLGNYYDFGLELDLENHREPHVLWLIHNGFLELSPKNYMLVTDKIERVTVEELEELI